MSWNARDHDHEWPFDSYATDFTLDPGSTALLVIDIQAGSVLKDPDSELGRTHPGVVDYWNRRMRDQVLPNTGRLIEAFRRRGLRVVYTRNGAMTPSGDEMTGRLRSRGGHGPDRRRPEGARRPGAQRPRRPGQGRADRLDPRA